MLGIAAFSLMLAVVPAAMFAVNLLFYSRPRIGDAAAAGSPVSVLIPARNEERSIGGAVEAALASRGVELEVVVMDDHSEDRTAEIVREIAGRDARVRLLTAPALPRGWCGKQHACFTLSEVARHDLMLFVDADVRLSPDGLRAALDFLERSGADLVSGIPRQITITLAEKIVIPLIHFVLLGFLPFPAMRRSESPAFAAGCGQFFLARRRAYERSGGHAAIRQSRHDGITLPRAFRAAGFKTDLFDATDAASCRMYRKTRDVWSGFAKNATEGMASPVAIGPWTVLLFGGQVLPFVVCIAALASGAGDAVVATAGLALGIGWTVRAVAAVRFRQSWTGAILHPVGVAVVLAIQWYALLQRIFGREIAWKGRAQIET